MDEASNAPTRRGLALEAVVACLTAAAFVGACFSIRVDPLIRIGQIAGLAGLAFRFAIAAIGLVVALVVAARWRGGTKFDLTSRLVCAAVAGLATGMIGGGLLVALRGTPWGLNGAAGDVGQLAKWAHALHTGDLAAIPAVYPPLPIHLLHLYSDLTGLAPGMALKHFEIGGVAAFGPIAYVSWRLVFRPGWALGIGVVAALPLIDPYKPYAPLVLAVFLPVAIAFLQALRASAGWDALRIARAGVIYGLAFGGLCLMYSGWFQWSVPGLAVAALIVFPWRSRRSGVLLLGLTALVFALVVFQYARGMLADPTGIKDNYVYFDVLSEPMYIAMWRGDVPGNTGVWPPIGELGGVGVFTLALAVGLGAAVALGRRKTLVIGLGAVMAGAWVLRFAYARKLWATKLVQLYPRTTPLLLYCLLLLAGYAVYLVIQRRGKPDGVSGLIGAVCGLLLFFASAGSALSDHYMPVNIPPPAAAAGWLTWRAHEVWQPAKPLRAHALAWTRARATNQSPPP